MADSKDTTKAIAELRKGLKLLSRERPVVLPHHKTFDMVEEMQDHLETLVAALGAEAPKKEK